jgi:predicted phosphodiesterase
MKKIILGDLHGDLELYKQVREKFSEPLVLLGDYLDSFRYSRLSQLELMKLVLEDVEAGRTEALLGNHELSYMNPDMRCSGFSSSFRQDLEYQGILARMRKHLKMFIYDEEAAILLTHAGLTRHNMKYVPTDEEFDIVEWLTEKAKLPQYNGPIYDIGESRGGSDRFGGILWCDWLWDFVPVPGITQIFGHTAVSGPTRKGDEHEGIGWNIDCLQYSYQFLEVEGKVIRTITHPEIKLVI